jgi:hypothetical protein
MTPVDARRYSNAAEGLKALEDSYNYWTGKTTDLAFQSSLALVAADWALISGLHPSRCAGTFLIVSIIIALASLLVGLWGARRMAHLHRRRFQFAESHRETWQKEWERSETTESQWPYTQEIENSGTRWATAKFSLLILAGVTFATGAVIALF